jgi:uncharacterized protein
VGQNCPADGLLSFMGIQKYCGKVGVMEANLKQKLNDDLRQSMRDRNELKTSTIRMLLSEIRYAELRKQEAEFTALAAKEGKKPDEEFFAKLNAQGKKPVELTDAEIQDVIAKEMKKRNDSIEAFKKGGRQDLVDKESAELAILKAYGPQMMGRDQILAEARQTIAEVGATGLADKSKVMPKIMAKLKGKADGREINEVVTDLLSKM